MNQKILLAPSPGGVKKIIWRVGLLLLLAIGGCGTTRPTHLVSLPEEMCKHCNCLMPAGVDPEALCPVCNCKKQAHQCVRGR